MNRQCGDCQLCCKLLPMQPGRREARATTALIEAGLARPDEFVGMLPEWTKPAGERCKFQKAGKGCAVYARRPLGCRLWNCRWLVDAGETSRPDRAHYVIDIMPDVIRMVPNEGDSAPVEIPVASGRPAARTPQAAMPLRRQVQ
jgi:Fe-S-cluster containining protein